MPKKLSYKTNGNLEAGRKIAYENQKSTTRPSERKPKDAFDEMHKKVLREIKVENRTRDMKRGYVGNDFSDKNDVMYGKEKAIRKAYIKEYKSKYKKPSPISYYEEKEKINDGKKPVRPKPPVSRKFKRGGKLSRKKC